MMAAIYFIGGGILAALLFLFRQKRISTLITLLFLLLQTSFTFLLFMNRGTAGLKYFTFDSLSLIFMLIMTVVATATFYHSVEYVRDDSPGRRALFFFSFIALNISLTGVYSANNIIVTWIFIELTTLAAAGLINHHRHLNALEATWKYVFICSVGIAIAYIGILFASVTSSAVHSGDMSYGGLKDSFSQINPVYLKMAFILILAGYSSKLEVFPLYTIGIDANYVAPAPVSAFLSSALVNGGFVAFYRVYETMAGSEIIVWINHVLLLTGILSLFVAAAYMQKANNLKRLFAYSTVEHMGLVLIALSFGPAGIYIALLQLTLHSLVKSGLFYQAGIMHRIMNTYKLSKTGGYLTLNPSGAIVLITGVALITAVPPSGLFLSEFMLFREMAAGHWALFWGVALLLTLIFYGIFMKNLKVVMGEPHQQASRDKRTPVSANLSQLLFFALVITACFYLPEFLRKLFTDVSGYDHISFFSLFNLK